RCLGQPPPAETATESVVTKSLPTPSGAGHVSLVPLQPTSLPRASTQHRGERRRRRRLTGQPPPSSSASRQQGHRSPLSSTRPRGTTSAVRARRERQTKTADGASSFGRVRLPCPPGIFGCETESTTRRHTFPGPPLRG